MYLAFPKLRQEREIKGWCICSKVAHDSPIVSDPGAPYHSFVWTSIAVSPAVKDSHSECPDFTYSGKASPLPITDKQEWGGEFTCKEFMIAGDVWNWIIHCKISWRFKGKEGKLHIKITEHKGVIETIHLHCHLLRHIHNTKLNRESGCHEPKCSLFLAQWCRN